MAGGPVFVCNNFWQSVADHHVDLPHETRHLYAPRPFAPGAVRDGDVVFVKTDLLDAFVDGLLPRIASRFVLVTGHSDLCPSPRAMAAVHADPRIARWYAANALWTDHKTTPIPIGLSEPDRAFGDQRIVAECAAAAAGATKAPRALLPATGPTHPLRRALQGYEHPLLDRLPPGKLSYRDYLTALAGHAFAVCPRGNGADVHRVHEALLMRAVPIYVSDQVPALFAGLPVIVVQSLPELTRVLDGLGGLAGLAGLAADVDWEAVQRYMLADRVADVYGLRAPLSRRRRL